MGWRLGIRKPGDNPYAFLDPEETVIMKSLHTYPDEPLLDSNDWDKIVTYYEQNAPETPKPQASPLAFDRELKNFTSENVFIGENLAPRTTLVKFDSIRHLLYVGDADKSLVVIKSDKKILTSWKVQSAPVDIDYTGSGIPIALCIGSIPPSDKKQGSLQLLGDAIDSSDTKLHYSNLARPVQFIQADLNGDENVDMVVCQFGNITGKLSWFDEGDPEKEHILISQAGPIHAVINDINNDGKPDIIALMAQAREELLLFINKGNNNFEEQTIKQFPPVYGVNYFELDDFNNDGHPDILMTNGDNWDLSPIRKNYHGIRILMNDGKNNFDEKYFFPIYGANKAMACDFDHDGDIDIAATAFYGNPEKPEESFIYLENKGDLNFSAQFTPAAAHGKWLTMDIGDFNKDGNTDIFLGSYFHTFSELASMLSKGLQNFPQVVILWNKCKPGNSSHKK